MGKRESRDFNPGRTSTRSNRKNGNTKVSIRYRALKLKYEALTTVTTIIEKTMSPAQLYASGSPLWANKYKGITIERILGKLYEEPKTEESFNRALAIIVNCFYQ